MNLLRSSVCKCSLEFPLDGAFAVARFDFHDDGKAHDKLLKKRQFATTIICCWCQMRDHEMFSLFPMLVVNACAFFYYNTMMMIA